MSFYIYTIHNILNNKIYVGKTNDPVRRWQKHVESAFSNRKDHKFYIHRAIAKYGVKGFVFTVIQQFNSEIEQYLAEKYWIQYFDSRNNKLGYNLTEGGEGCVGRILSQTTKNKIQSSLIGHSVSQDTRNKIANKLIGRERLQDFKDKISKARIGFKHLPDAKLKISNGKLGELNPQSKLNEQKVIDIRNMFDSGLSIRKISEIFDVSKKTIENVVKRISWKHVE
jgi:group I intron endonuclease